jgi:hypothetical protein
MLRYSLREIDYLVEVGLNLEPDFAAMATSPVCPHRRRSSRLSK